jgi:Grx4 family monothiol glutaredoxin
MISNPLTARLQIWQQATGKRVCFVIVKGVRSVTKAFPFSDCFSESIVKRRAGRKSSIINHFILFPTADNSFFDIILDFGKIIILFITGTVSSQSSTYRKQYTRFFAATICHTTVVYDAGAPDTIIMSTLNEITSESEFDSHVSSLPPSSLLVLSFHTPWAAPCAQMRTVLSTLASGYPVTSPPTVSFVSVNAEELPDISEDYDVTAVPFLVLIRDRKVLESISGSDAIKVRNAVERHAGPGVGGSNGAAKTAIPPALNATPRADVSGAPTEAPALASSTNGDAAAVAAPTTTPQETQEALFARLAELVKAAPVMLFMKGTPSSPQCGFSRQLVSILRENGVKYGFFNILADEDVRQGLKEFAEWPTFPQLWMRGELVGGLDIVCPSLCPALLSLFISSHV